MAPPAPPKKTHLPVNPLIAPLNPLKGAYSAKRISLPSKGRAGRGHVQGIRS